MALLDPQDLPARQVHPLPPLLHLDLQDPGSLLPHHQIIPFMLPSWKQGEMSA